MQTATRLYPDQKDEKSSTPSLFDQIYEIAKHARKNPDTAQKLSVILTPNTCIDVRDGSQIYTPASKLAKEGNKEAVDLLMKLGANINSIAVGAACGGYRKYAEYLRLNHRASVDSIAYGAACGGHRNFAEDLRRNHGANVHEIARGAALGGHREYAENLRRHHGANVHEIAYGAARGGHREYAEYLRLNHGASVHRIAGGTALSGHREYAEYLRLNHGAGVHRIASDAALGGHHEYAEYLRQHHGANVHEIARGAALGGHREYAEYLRLNHGAGVHCIAGCAALGGHREYAEYLRRHHGASVDIIAQGAALGGHREYAEYLRRNHGASVDFIAQGAALGGGHREYAEYLRLNHGANVSIIARGAAWDGNHDYAEDLYINHHANMHWIAAGALLSGGFSNPKSALYSLSRMTSGNYRVKIAKALKNKKLVNYDVIKLISKAEKIAELRPKYNFDQCIALGNREIQTWFLQGAVLIGSGRGKITHESFLSIATFLSSLTSYEANDLFKKSRFDIFQKLLILDVKKHYTTTRTLFFGNDKKVEAFSAVCAYANNNNGLSSLLSIENKRITNEKDQQKPNTYGELIRKHQQRITPGTTTSANITPSEFSKVPIAASSTSFQSISPSVTIDLTTIKPVNTTSSPATTTTINTPSPHIIINAPDDKTEANVSTIVSSEAPKTKLSSAEISPMHKLEPTVELSQAVDDNKEKLAPTTKNNPAVNDFEKAINEFEFKLKINAFKTQGGGEIKVNESHITANNFDIEKMSNELISNIQNIHKNDSSDKTTALCIKVLNDTGELIAPNKKDDLSNHGNNHASNNFENYNNLIKEVDNKGANWARVKQIMGVILGLASIAIPVLACVGSFCAMGPLAFLEIGWAISSLFIAAAGVTGGAVMVASSVKERDLYQKTATTMRAISIFKNAILSVNDKQLVQMTTALSTAIVEEVQQDHKQTIR